jgi:two-component system, NtrC family, response regulator AtoC
MGDRMSRKGKVLVVDDEASLRLLLSNELSREGFSVDVAGNAAAALALMREGFYHVVLLDIIMPGMDGMALFKAMRAEQINAEVIILTGNATIESAVESMRLGAFEYMRKPYDLNELIILINRAIEHQSAEVDRRMLREELKKSSYGGRLVGNSLAIKNLYALIGRISQVQSTVLITGESGTGKELVARTIHEESPRRGKQFVAVSCAALPPNLLESELFGYEKGAFTDAKSQKRGLAETADGGTLFLDEIGELPMVFQAKLLRFLETGEIRRVGGTKDISLDVRILCATNRSLEKLVETGEFRADLFYRFNVVSLHVPPLNEHAEDIPLLVESFIGLQSMNKRFDENAMNMLMKYDWPGNIRELKNVVERACILSNDLVIRPGDISFLKVRRKAPTAEQKVQEVDDQPKKKVFSMSDLEREHIIQVLKHVGGHKGKAAKLMEINPKTLYRKMKQYHIVKEFNLIDDE